MNTTTDARATPRPLVPSRGGLLARVRVRWWIFAFMCAFAFMSYILRQPVTVAAVPMMPELHFSQFQIGMLYWAFVAGYTCFQLLGGVYGQRMGARRCFVVISLIAFVCVMALPLAPSVTSGMTLFVALMITQSVLGVSQGPVFPVSAGVFETWFPPPRWSLVLGVQAMFMDLGGAAAPLVLTRLMDVLGWKEAVVLTSLPALLLVPLWAWYGRNTPREHPKVTAEELAEIGGSAPIGITNIDWRRRSTPQRRDILDAGHSAVAYPPFQRDATQRVDDPIQFQERCFGIDLQTRGHVQASARDLYALRGSAHKHSVLLSQHRNSVRAPQFTTIKASKARSRQRDLLQ